MVDYLREFTSQGCDTFLFRSDDEDEFPGHGDDKDDWEEHLKIIDSVSLTPGRHGICHKWHKWH